MVEKTEGTQTIQRIMRIMNGSASDQPGHSPWRLFPSLKSLESLRSFFAKGVLND